MSSDISLRSKLSSLLRLLSYRPKFVSGIVTLSLLAAILEGVGLGFIIPVIEQARADSTDPNAITEGFLMIYNVLGLPFELPYIIAGVSLVMIVRFTASFVVAWLGIKLQTDYIRNLQTTAFENALGARIDYFDDEGSDEILNAIVTQVKYTGEVIDDIVTITQETLLAVVYLSIAIYLAPLLTILSGVILGGILYTIRRLLESGYSVGDRVADANERVQTAVQAGTQGIRDVKIFGMDDEIFDEFERSVDDFVTSTVKFTRNQAAMRNFYQLAIAVTVFVLIYAAVAFANLSLAALGAFLFAMFRLSPRVSTLNNTVYRLEGNLPHLVRTQEFIDELAANAEPDEMEKPAPEEVDTIEFDDIDFSYSSDEQILDGLSFEAQEDDFLAFVGQSGAGKSTIVSLLARLYDPDSGEIRANGEPIDAFDIDDWREEVAVVRQDPFIFNDTLRYNITIGNRNADEEAIRHACEIAQVSEFLDDLPKGLETQLGDNGVRLSGGQRQRVALARAVLKDADVLVLDEATSDLDSNLEEQVHSGIEAMGEDRIMIVIAHRLSTVVDADRIYTVEDGQIVEMGDHHELLARDGPYAELYATQTQDPVTPSSNST